MIVVIYVWLLIANLAAHRFRTPPRSVTLFGVMGVGLREGVVLVGASLVVPNPVGQIIGWPGYILGFPGLACRSTLLLAAKVFTDRGEAMTDQIMAGPAPTLTQFHVRSWPLLSIGGVCGCLGRCPRGFMAQVAGARSQVCHGVEPSAGFCFPVLSPGCCSVAEYLRRTGGRRGWRWLLLSPPGYLRARLLPGSSIRPRCSRVASVGERSESLYGMAGGYALSGRGPRWARISCGLLFATMIPIWALTVPGFGGPDLAATAPRGAWVALYYWSLMIVLALACATPHRAIEQTRSVPS